MLRKKEKKEEKKEAWMTTYSDMVTLLMVFFIMLIAFGEVKEVKTRIILSAFSGKLGVLGGGQSLDTAAEFETLGSSFESLPSSTQGDNLQRKESPATEVLNPYVRSKRVRVIDNEEGITISLFTDTFFEKGSAEVDFASVREILENIRLLMDSEAFEGGILIEGHTDAIPYQGDEFKDSWDLSAARAWSVLQALRLVPSIFPLDESKISIHGYGPNRPIESNDTPYGRAYNRRVDIVLKRKEKIN